MVKKGEPNEKRRAYTHDSALEILVSLHAERGYDQPQEISEYPGTANAKWYMVCSQGHPFFTTLHFITRKGYEGNGCARCMRNNPKTITKYTQKEALQILKKNLNKNKIPPMQEIQPYPGRTKNPWFMICSEGHECKTNLSRILNGTHPCRICGRIKGATNRRLTQVEAEKLLKKHLKQNGYALPTEIGEYPKLVNGYWPMICSQGHDCKPTLSRIMSGHSICGRCSKNARFTHAEAEEKLFSILAKRGIPFPLSIGEYPGSTHEWWNLVCSEGHETRIRLNELRRTGGICTACSRKGFQRKEPAWLYLIGLDIEGDIALNLGITKALNRRIRQHRKAGDFQPYGDDILYSEEGVNVLNLETLMKSKIAALLEETGASSPSLSTPTEEFRYSQLSVSNLRELLLALDISVGDTCHWYKWKAALLVADSVG